MTLDAYTLLVFSAGLRAGAALVLLVLSAKDGLFVLRYVRRQRTLRRALAVLAAIVNPRNVSDIDTPAANARRTAVHRAMLDVVLILLFVGLLWFAASHRPDSYPERYDPAYDEPQQFDY